MCALKLLRKLLVKFDFFPATQFLRYKGQTSYRTATGGVFTILIVIIFFILFANALIDILNKKDVTLTTDTQHQTIPEATNIKFGPSGGFMLAISIGGMNLSRTDLKYFDITLSLNEYIPITQIVNSTTIPLEMCTVNHFKFDEELAQNYKSLNGSNLLCPQLNYVAEIKGKLTSDIMKRLTVTIKKCDASVSQICANDTMVQQLQNSLGYFGLGIALVNTELNPSQSKSYKQFYLDDQNFFAFTTTLAVRGIAQIEEYKIQTDQSIFPLSDNLIEKGLRVPANFQYSVIPVLSDTYATIHLQKSSTFTTYSRSYRKLATLFSYVGGLIGSILGFIFVLDSYNELCYQLSLGSRLCTYDDEQDIKAEKFNFLYYFAYFFYKLVRNFFSFKQIGMMHIFTECQQEIEKQLDVRLIMKKLIFFERFIGQAGPKLKINLPSLLSKGTLYEIRHFRFKYQDSLLDKDQKEQSVRQNNKNIQLIQQSTIKQVNISQIVNQPQNDLGTELKNDLLNKQSQLYNTQYNLDQLNNSRINRRAYNSQIYMQNPPQQNFNDFY